MDGLVPQPILDTLVTQDGIVVLDIPVILGQVIQEQVGQEPIEVTVVAGQVQAVALDIAPVWDITPV